MVNYTVVNTLPESPTPGTIPHQSTQHGVYSGELEILAQTFRPFRQYFSKVEQKVRNLSVIYHPKLPSVVRLSKKKESYLKHKNLEAQMIVL